MNNLYGITGIKVKGFGLLYGDEALNNFLKEHDGDIIDIQMALNNSAIVIYKDNKEKD